jgi:hypothetical protein
LANCSTYIFVYWQQQQQIYWQQQQHQAWATSSTAGLHGTYDIAFINYAAIGILSKVVLWSSHPVKTPRDRPKTRLQLHSN